MIFDERLLDLCMDGIERRAGDMAGVDGCTPFVFPDCEMGLRIAQERGRNSQTRK